MENSDENSEERTRRQNRERQARLRKRVREESSSDVIEAKKQKLAEDKRVHRAQETAEETQSRRDGNAQSQRLRRQKETPEETRSRLDANAQSQRLRHQQETAEETRSRLDANAQSQRLRRQMETAEQTQSRRETDLHSHRLQLSLETEEDRESRLLANEAYRIFTQDMQSQSIREEAISFNENEIIAHSCGQLNIVCNFCQSKNFIEERPDDNKFNQCCRKGKVMLKKPTDTNGNELTYPTFLRDLLSNRNNPECVAFRENIRAYNNAVSFASMGGKIVEPPGRGPYVFKMHGQTYHKTSHLLPPSSQVPQYAQLYVIDSSQATSIRQQHIANQKCSPQILNQIDRFFRENNRIAQTYNMMREIENQFAETAIAAGIPPPEISMIFRRDRHSDQRRYNAPTSNEIAMIFVDTDGEPPFERDIRIYPKNPEDPRKQFVNLSILSPNMDPMTYSLLYPYGEPGWQPSMKCNPYPNVQVNAVRTNVSMLQYKVAQTAIRDEFNPILSAGKLTQQWIVDSYLQVLIISLILKSEKFIIIFLKG